MDVTIPKLGLTMETGALTRWLVSEGDHVTAEQPIAEVATDKIENEIVAPADGIIQGLHPISEEDELEVGTVIARIRSD